MNSFEVSSCVPQDFADITSEPSLDQPIIIEEDDDADTEEESSQTSSFLLASSMSIVVQVHQRLCLSYAHSLWYQPAPPTNHTREHISALVSSYQITAPLIARFYHLMGMKKKNIIIVCVCLNTDSPEPFFNPLCLRL